MQQKSVTKKLIIDLAVALLILAACVIVGTYAWMTRNTALKAENYNMQILAPDIVVRDYKVYQYNAETNKVDNVTNEDGDYEMTQYDSIFLERNVYTPLLFVVDLGNVTPGAISVNVFCNTLHTEPALHFTSNVICVKAASGYTINSFAQSNNGGEVSYDDTEEARMHLFDSAAKYFKTDNTKGQFCHVTKEGTGASANYIFDTKKTYISFDLNLVADDLVPQADGTTTAQVYLIVDYAPDLVEAQRIEAFSDIDIQSVWNKPIKYENDITTISFETKKNDGH